MKQVLKIVGRSFSTQAQTPEFNNYYILKLHYSSDGYYETCTKI